jgi:hypothetical protein
VPAHDALRPQRLAAPATIYVEQHSAHPLEADGRVAVRLTATSRRRRFRKQRIAERRRSTGAAPRMASIRCPTWRCRPTAALGGGARPRARPRPRHGRVFPTAAQLPRRSTACRSR